MLTIDEMNAVTRNTLLKQEPTDVVHYQDPFATLMFSKKVDGISYTGGPAFGFRFEYDKQPLKPYDGNTLPAMERKAKFSLGTMSFSYQTADASITHNEWLSCNGNDQFEINLMTRELRSAQMAFKQDMPNFLFIAQAGLAPNSIYDAMIGSSYAGLSRTGVREDPTSGKGYYLMPYVVTSTAKADNIKALNKMWFYQTTRFSAFEPDALVVSDNTYDLMFDTMANKSGYLFPLTSQKALDLGFKSSYLSYNGVPIVRNNNIPDYQVWSLPFSYIGWVPHPQEPWAMEERGWHLLDENSMDKGARFIGCGNVVCTNPGALAICNLSIA